MDRLFGRGLCSFSAIICRTVDLKVVSVADNQPRLKSLSAIFIECSTAGGSSARS